jgi:hypothetical protein
MVSGVLPVKDKHLTIEMSGTSNEQDDDDSYANISTLFELGQYVESRDSFL